jgi:hypothetical protein
LITQIANYVNLGFSWSIVILALFGYFLTLKRTGGKMPFWLVLAGGWICMAILYLILIINLPIGRSLVISIALVSFILVMTSMMLIFLKVVSLLKNKKL